MQPIAHRRQSCDLHAARRRRDHFLMLLLASRARGLAALRVGPVGARRVKTGVALGGAALLATQQNEADCAAGQNLRVASCKSVLSSSSASRATSSSAPRENLDPPTRLKRVQALLEQETKKHAVVCLQSLRASGRRPSARSSRGKVINLPQDYTAIPLTGIWGASRGPRTSAT